MKLASLFHMPSLASLLKKPGPAAQGYPHTQFLGPAHWSHIKIKCPTTGSYGDTSSTEDTSLICLAYVHLNTARSGGYFSAVM